MEYIYVKVSRMGEEAKGYLETPNGIKIRPRVTINGELNGSTGKILEVEAGALEVSVRSVLIKSDTVKLILDPNSTSVNEPKEVIVICGFTTVS